MATHSSTIIGVFNRYATAEQAARKLTEVGIPQDAVQIKSEMKTQTAGGSRMGDEADSGGGISGFFRRLFGADTPEDHVTHLTKQYSDVIDRGGAVVCVTATEADVSRAVDVLNQYGAIDIDEQSGKAETSAIRETSSQRQYSGGTAGGTTIPVVEEELQVGKRVVRRGGVRIYSQTVEQPVEEEVALREEHVHVERRPVDRPATAADESTSRQQSFEVTETAEEPIVNKQRRVKEEVLVRKDATERKETIRDSVRRTEVNVEQMAESGAAQKYTDDFRRDYEANYASSGVDYAAIQPAYEYGYTTASDPRYRGKSWSDVEPELRTDYLRRSPNSTWDKVKGAVRYGWEKVTARR